MKRLHLIFYAYIIALCIFAAIWGLLGRPDFESIDPWMNVSEVYGAVLAFIAFPLIIAEFLRFTRGFISIEDLKHFQEAIKKKISDKLPQKDPGRQPGDFSVLFTEKPDEALIKFYGDTDRSWNSENYSCVTNKAAIKSQFGDSPNDFWIVCLSANQRFVSEDPSELSNIQFTEAEKAIMLLIANNTH